MTKKGKCPFEQKKRLSITAKPFLPKERIGIAVLVKRIPERAKYVPAK